MTIFVLDPQGEFAQIRNNSKVLEVFNRLGKQLQVYSFHNLVLTGNDLFKKLLKHSGFFDELRVFYEDNKERAADYIDEIPSANVRSAFVDGKVELWHYYKRDIFNLVMQSLQTRQGLSAVYGGDQYQERLLSAIHTANMEHLYQIWQKVANLFSKESRRENTVMIKDLTKIATEEAKGEIVIIDLSEINIPNNIMWNDDIRLIVINEFLRSLT